MFPTKSFGRNDTILKILPSTLLILFVYMEMYDKLSFEYKIGWTEFFFLLIILSYPIGTIFQQFAISIRSVLLKKTKYSDDVLILLYLQCDREGFWTKYLKFYSEADSELISLVEEENVNKFFFLNMAFVTLISLVIHTAIAHNIINFIAPIQIILIIVFIKYHFQSQGYYYYILNKAIISLNRSSKK